MSSKKLEIKTESVAAAEPLLTRLFVAPILFVSFLVSLFLIDRRNHRTIFSNAEEKSDHYHSHQRKLAKQQASEAFQLRRRIIMAFCIFCGVSLAVFAWGVESIWKIWKVQV